MKMFFVSGDETPTAGVARKRQPAVIPPFTFSGPLDQGESGVWFPPRAIILKEASVAATWPGTADAGLLLYRLEFGNQRTLMGFTSLGKYNATPPGATPEDVAAAIQGQTRAKFEMASEAGIEPPTVSPFEGMFIQSMSPSGHENVVVQIIGEYL